MVGTSNLGSWNGHWNHVKSRMRRSFHDSHGKAQDVSGRSWGSSSHIQSVLDLFTYILIYIIIKIIIITTITNKCIYIYYINMLSVWWNISLHDDFGDKSWYHNSAPWSASDFCRTKGSEARRNLSRRSCKDSWRSGPHSGWLCYMLCK